MIDFEHVSMEYKRGGRLALEDVSLHVDPGEFVFLVGHSGAGKSTLLKLILREVLPSEGKVFVDGKDVARLRRSQVPYLRRQMGVIFQDFRLIPTMTVYENVAFAMHVTNVGAKQIRDRVDYMLELVHLEDKANSYPDYLSGGEQQRAALAKVLLLGPEILLLDDEGNELLLPKTEQIPSDFYRKGETARAVVARVDNKNNNPKIILSRTSPVFLQRLFEQEVPEINDGLITIKKIARIPGERAKIAVESYDERIDPVGACVGVKGSRIHGIVRELRNENIDVINYTSNISLFIQRALSPAKISSIRVNEEEHKAEVYLRPEEVSLAIGKGGLNIKLACMLTEYAIDVFRDVEGADEEDIYLDEFSDEIDSWVIEALKNIGCYTAKSVLAMNREEIVERADLEEQTVDEVLAILSAEFEEEEGEPQE